MSGPKQFCSFWLGDRMFGVAVERVQEVLRYMEMTPIPLAPRRIAGLINLRGRILTVIDLRRRFGMESERGSGQNQEAFEIAHWVHLHRDLSRSPAARHRLTIANRSQA